MLAAICRGEMKAWQELMREDIWPGVTFKWVWCDVHPPCIEASPAEYEIICHNSLVVNGGFMTGLLVSHRQVVDESERKLKTLKDTSLMETQISCFHMSQMLLLGKVEYGGGPIFKVVLEC